MNKFEENIRCKKCFILLHIKYLLHFIKLLSAKMDLSSINQWRLNDTTN